MNALKKQRIKTVLKYTWPFYIVGGLIVYIALSVVFKLAHPIPAYKTLTLFVTGEVTDTKKFSQDMIDKYQDKELKSVSCIASRLTDGNYTTKLSVAGYTSADVLIIPFSKLETLNASYFAIDLKNELIETYYQDYSLYKQNDLNYGIKINKNKVAEYLALPEEDCYMLFNANSQNLGDYSKKPVKEHNTALLIVKDWGM